jgi:hypothetical protein
MKIDRSNYEIWLIDWLDGNLNENQIHELKNFLNQNPDLSNEFYDMLSAKLTPPVSSFQQKEELKRTAADLTESQLDYLSVAYLEKDLAPEQTSELLEITGKDQVKKRSFELMQKMKLEPVQILYKRKNHLHKKTAAQKVISFSLIGLSAAAIVTFAILNFFSVPQSLTVKNNKAVPIISSVTGVQNKTINKISEKQISDETKAIPEKHTKHISYISKRTSVRNQSQEINPPDSMMRTPADPSTLVSKIPVGLSMNIDLAPLRNNLIANNIRVRVPREEEYETSKLSRFIAKTFREKFLKEKSAKDTPLKAYEIAEAGVSGLNLLLGWQMALDEKRDENGELKSVYFSSKIIKFNAQIKKTDPAR